MLQRNTSGYPIELPTLGLGRYIHPGEDFDHDDRLAGFTPVDELDQDDDTDAQPDGDDTTGAGRNAPATGDTTDEHTVPVRPLNAEEA